MNFLADENVDLKIVEKLRENNHIVFNVSEIQPIISDKEILKIANQRSAVLITADKDFGELIFRQKMINNGVILLRLHGQSSELKAAALLKFIEKHFGEIIDSFSVVSNNAIRIRRRIN